MKKGLKGSGFCNNLFEYQRNITVEVAVGNLLLKRD